MNKEKISESFKNILEAIGENVDRDGIKNTPFRMAESYSEYFSGLNKDPNEFLKNTIKSSVEDIIIEKNIDFYSICEHHLVPFIGTLDIAYIPNGKIIGFGDIIKAFEILCRRPQLQERLGEEFADILEKNLNPLGLYIRIKAMHTCMTLRGVKKVNSEIVTRIVRGNLKEDAMLRLEIINLLDK